MTRVEYEMLRGLELVCHQKSKGDPASFEIRWHALRDFLHFEVYAPYVPMVKHALGPWRFLYVRVVRVEYATLFYYALPIGLPILLGRELRRAWMYPARWAYMTGHLEVDPGAVVPLLWPVRLRFRAKPRLTP